MSTNLTTTGSKTTIRGQTSKELRSLAEQAQGYVESAKSEATLKAYRSDWKHFTSWCDQHSLDALPARPESVALYLASMAGVKAAATIQRRLTSIAEAHRLQGLPTPTTDAVAREAWRGVRRVFGTASHGAAAITTSELRTIVGTLDDRLIDVRNRALLLLGFAGALRRSELVSIDVEHITETADGLVLRLQRSKTDQMGEGHELGLPYGSTLSTCPVRSYRGWIEASGISTGPLFRPVNRHGRLGQSRLSDRAVADVVKAAASRAGFDPRLFSAHSLRVGLITSAAAAGVPERDIMRHSRHASVQVMRQYVRTATVWQDNAAAAVGL